LTKWNNFAPALAPNIPDVETPSRHATAAKEGLKSVTR